MKIIRFILGLVKWAILVGITLLALYLFSSNFNVFGGYQPFLVQSGSMEPAIMTGDVIVIQNRGTYFINDVVSFRTNADRIVTHRIVAVEKGKENRYSTKGDANRSGDEDIITNKQVIGKVVLVIPKLGYFVAFSKSRSGLIWLLIIPAAILILDELIKIKKHA
ncbi:MAG: signal peptidase I [Patescibacteria group bacterium]